MFHSRLLLAILPGLLTIASLQAADAPSPAETKLREALRNTMLQLRTAETERATLQATQTESEEKNQALTAQIETLTKQAADEKDAATKAATEAQTKIDRSDLEIIRLNKEVANWKAEQNKAANLAASKETQRAQLAAQVIVLQRKVADQQTKNATMFKLGNEILVRYEKFGLGDALLAREPFVGITRVKFENLMQDYSDQLVDTKIKP